MKKIRIVILFILFFQLVTAQDEMKINFDDIKLKISNQESNFYYPKLLKRFNEFDNSLTTEEYSLIYYGFTFQNDYLKNQPDESILNDLMQSEKFAEIVIECEKILKLNPVSLSANDNMGYALYKLEKPENEWKKFQNRYRAIRKVIAYSGNGLSCESALKVIYVSDEYNMINSYFHIEEIKKQKLVGLCDKFEIKPSQNFQNSEIFFDISRKLIRQGELIKK